MVKEYFTLIKWSVIGLLFAISVGLNVYFLLGKGITINNTTVSNSTSNSFSSSGSVAIGYIGDTQQGNYDIEIKEFKRVDEIGEYLRTISVGKQLLTKIVHNSSADRYYTFTPNFESNKK